MVGGVSYCEQTTDRGVKPGPDWLVEQGEADDVMGTRTRHGSVD